MEKWKGKETLDILITVSGCISYFSTETTDMRQVVRPATAADAEAGSPS
jgi:hypothetical protein